MAGPLKIDGDYARGVFYVPLATTESALVRSYERGMVTISRASGASTQVLTNENRVSPIFVFDDVAAAAELTRTVGDRFAELQAAAEATTRHGRLLRVEPQQVERAVILTFAYWTADAHGMNMIVRATEAACRLLLADCRARRFYIFSGAESEKRASGALFAGGKGKKVVAGALIFARLVRAYLHTTPEELVELWRFTVLGHL